MAEKVGELYLEMVARNGKLLSTLQQTERRAQGFTGKLGSTFKKLGSSMIGSIVGGLGAFTALQKSVEAVRAGIERALDLEALTVAFENLAGGAGKAEEMMTRLDKAFRGTVESVTMLKQANTAMILGVAQNAEEMEFLGNAARRLGKAVGLDTARAFESLVVGIGRQSKLWLDNLGIIVNTEEAYKTMAAQLNKTVSELTDAQKKQAFMNATMTATRRALSKLGADIETAGTKWQKFKTTWTDVFTTIGAGITSLAEGFHDLVVDFTQGIQGIFTGTAASEIKKIHEDIAENQRQQMENEADIADILAERARKAAEVKRQMREQLELSRKMHAENRARWEEQEKVRKKLWIDELRLIGQTRKAEEEAAKMRAAEMEDAAETVEQQLQVSAWLRAKLADIAKRYREQEEREEEKHQQELLRIKRKGEAEMAAFRRQEQEVERRRQEEDRAVQNWERKNANLTIKWLREIGRARAADIVALEQWRDAEIEAAEGGIDRLMIIDKLYKARLKKLQETRKEIEKPAWIGAEQLWKRAVTITKAAEPAVKREPLDVKIDPSKVDMDTLVEISKQTTLQEQMLSALENVGVLD